MRVARAVGFFATMLAVTAADGLAADWTPSSYIVEVLVDPDGGPDACRSGRSAAFFEFWTHPDPGSDDDRLTSASPVDASRNGLGCDTVGKLHAKGSTLCSRVITGDSTAGRLKGTVDRCGLRFEIHGFDAGVQSTKACCDRKDPRNTRACSVVEWGQNCPNGDELVLGRGTDCGDCNPAAAFGTEVEEPDIRGCCGIAASCVSLDATRCATSGGMPLGSGCFPGACEPEPKKREPPPKPPPPVPAPPQLGRCTIIRACPGGDRILCVNSTEEQCRTTSGSLFEAGDRCAVVQNECPPFSLCDDAAGSYRLDEYELLLDPLQRAFVGPAGAPATRRGSWSCVVEGTTAAVTISWSDGGTDTIAIERVGGRKTVRPLGHQDPVTVMPRPLPTPRPPAPVPTPVIPIVDPRAKVDFPADGTCPAEKDFPDGYKREGPVGDNHDYCKHMGYEHAKWKGGEYGKWVCNGSEHKVDDLWVCRNVLGDAVTGVCYKQAPGEPYRNYNAYCIVKN